MVAPMIARRFGPNGGSSSPHRIYSVKYDIRTKYEMVWSLLSTNWEKIFVDLRRDAKMGDDGDRVEAKLRALVRSWGLSRFSEEMAWQWLLKCLGDDGRGHGSADPMARVRKWILLQLNQQRHPPAISHWQRGSPELIPSLTSRAVWDCTAFPWVEKLEAAFPAIKAELLALKGQKGFQPYRAPSWASDSRVMEPKEMRWLCPPVVSHRVRIGVM
jgi:hypothetical protein